MNYGQFSGVYTFLENGDFSGVHYVAGAGLAGHPHGHLSSNNSADHLESIAWANFIDDANQVGAQEPSGKFGRTFRVDGLTASISGSMGSFTTSGGQVKTYIDAAGQAKSIYDNPIPLSTVAGTFSGIMRSAGISMPLQKVTGMVIDAGGRFTYSVANCDFQGVLNPHGSSGVFDVMVQTSGPSCKLNPSIKGIATPLSISGNNLRLALQLDSADNTQSAVFDISK